MAPSWAWSWSGWRGACAVSTFLLLKVDGPHPLWVSYVAPGLMVLWCVSSGSHGWQRFGGGLGCR